MNNIFYSL